MEARAIERAYKNLRTSMNIAPAEVDALYEPMTRREGSRSDGRGQSRTKRRLYDGVFISYQISTGDLYFNLFVQSPAAPFPHACLMAWRGWFQAPRKCLRQRPE